MSREVRALLCATVALPLVLGAQACGSSTRHATTASTSASTSSKAPTAVVLPKASNGASVRVLGRGVPIPTSIAVGAGTVFVGAAGSEEGSKQPGGLFALAGGVARRVPHTPAKIFGVAYDQGSLYVTSGPSLVKFSGWNGTSFARRRTLYRGPKHFDGFNGIAFGPDGRIYAGVSLNEKDDHHASSAPYGQSVISLSPQGGSVKVIARGLREPFQLAFVGGKPNPYVSVLGQDNLGKSTPPDYIVAARAGQNYGFPACNWSKPKACARYAKPLVLLPAHSSPMGIGSIGTTLYVALFGGTGHGPEVASIPAAGGAPKPLLSGFVEPVVALTTSGGSVYVGDLSGAIYSVSVASTSNS